MLLPDLLVSLLRWAVKREMKGDSCLYLLYSNQNLLYGSIISGPPEMKPLFSMVSKGMKVGLMG